MRKVSSRFDKRKRERQFDEFVNFFLQTNGIDGTRAILETILTESEKAAVAQRLAIMRLIHKGEKYQDISSSLGVVQSTISKTVDLFHKNGQHNAMFNKLLSGFTYETKQEKESAKVVVKDPQLKIITGGFRQMMRGEAKAKKEKLIDL